ncbi:MAG: hypothetical protein ACRCY4_04030 [Brevinema sp.]
MLDACPHMRGAQLFEVTIFSRKLNQQQPAVEVHADGTTSRWGTLRSVPLRHYYFQVISSPQATSATTCPNQLSPTAPHAWSTIILSH